MSEMMERAILTMPYELVMGDELARMQFWSRAQLVYKELEHLRAQTVRDNSNKMHLCLCEFAKVVPQPNRLYRPIHHPGCKTCDELAAAQTEAYGSRSPTYEELEAIFPTSHDPSKQP